MPLVKLCQHVWSLSTPDEEGCLDGMQMRPLMLMSGLDNATLGTIWTMVDVEPRGKVRRRRKGDVGVMKLISLLHFSRSHRSTTDSWALSSV